MRDANPDQRLLEGLRIDPTLGIPPLHQALRIALYDEYHARATYQKIVDAFGPVPPFINIIQAEERHGAALLPLFPRYGVAMPVDDWYPRIEIAPTLVENCEIGVAAEIENIAMYDNLLSYVAEPDVREVFYHLQAASYNNHLPAFRRCVAARAETAPAQNPDAAPGNEELMNRIAGMMNGKFDPSQLTGLFSNMGGEFLAGALAGGVLGALLGGNASNERS